MNPSDVTTQSFPRSVALVRACRGARIADSAGTLSTDADLGHSTIHTLEYSAASPLTDEQAAGLGRLVRKIVNSPLGIPGGFDTVEDLCRGYLDAQLSAPTRTQTRFAVQRTLDRLASRPAHT